MTRILAAVFLTILMYSCVNFQKKNTRKLVDPCEGCEAIFEYGDKALTSTDTLPDFHEQGIKIKVEGTIYQPDKKSPAKNVILYVYHTNQEGEYVPEEGATGWGQRHGYNRGWVKTDKDGQYAFYTLQPAPYPNRSEPAHIHYTVLEPDGKYYWLRSCYFEGDSLLTSNDINPESPRGGSSGLLTLRKEGDLMIGLRDIVLGANIPNYE